MEQIAGIIRQQEVVIGSKSDGNHSFLEIPNKEEPYKLYRQDVYSVDDSYFDQFKNQEVIVSGEFQHDEWIMVENIKPLKLEKE